MKDKNISKSYIINFIGVALLFAVVFCISHFGLVSKYVLGIITVAFISIIMATSLNLTTGLLGQIALGHAGFMAIGGYTSALLTKYMDQIDFLNQTPTQDVIRFLIALIAGGLLAAAFGALVGIPALRLRGDYLAIITLGFGEIIRVVIQNLPFAGSKGLSQGQAGQPLIGINLISKDHICVIFVIVIICVSLIFTFIRSKYGRAILSIREDDIASSASGVNTTFYKVLTFAYSAFFAGVAGAIYAHYLGSLDPATFTFNKSIEYLIMVVFGGMASITGSIIAATLLGILSEVLRAFSEYRMLLYAVALVIVMIFRPQGIFGTWEFSLTRTVDKVVAFCKGGKKDVK